MDTQTKEGTLHLVVIVALVVMVGIVSFFKWPSDVTGATPLDPCVVPDDGRHYLADTTLCAGEYHLPKGITLGKDGIILDCNGAVLNGDGKNGNGITLAADSLTVKNCHVINYKNGLRINGNSNNEIVGDSNTFKDNTYFYTRDPRDPGNS